MKTSKRVHKLIKELNEFTGNLLNYKESENPWRQDFAKILKELRQLEQKNKNVRV